MPEKKHQPDGYWKNLLAYTVEDLVEQQADAGRRVVFFFDEMPWMLSAIADAERDGPTTAMEVLDVLRSLPPVAEHRTGLPYDPVRFDRPASRPR